jgi:hypothetical protein
LKWIQHFVNEDSAALNGAIGIGDITWLSPLKADGCAEYRDSDFLNLLKVDLPKESLSSFWPDRGPQWDAIGRAARGDIVLVEAKAHVTEVLSPRTKAGEKSVGLIRKSLARTANALGARLGAVDWSQTFYQYTNRVAHAHFLHVINGIPAVLVFLYFVGDKDVDGPANRREWEAAEIVLHEALGLRGKIPKYVKSVCLDVPA